MHLNHSIEMNRFSLILTKQESTSYSLDDIYSSTATFPSLDYNIHTTTGDVTFDMSIKYHCPFLYWRFIEIVGSCNGLICLISDTEFLGIWNLIAQEYNKLPQIPKVSPQTQNLLPPIAHVATYGFGYDCKTGVYKIVQIVTAGCDMFSQVRVCTLGTDSWRLLNYIPYMFYLYGKANGVLLDGILHWLVHPCNGVNKPIRVILSFNVGEETFVEMQLPKPLCSAPEGEHYFKTNIGLLDGKLCLSWNLGDGNVDV
ncbi:F-box/kelch-repeat protein At3g06240-like [Papaver somniferum]|uniref:F-box/kelch-repeat protein At3g06240-like n=1 Tax=Papaver somniferum TaxID=3469 RepID=UPI000E6FE581|nr:F-box/kelch-repeat protein At3g06240-like [Papaver somniferum]